MNRTGNQQDISAEAVPPVRYEVVAKSGFTTNRNFATAQEAAAYARELYPDQQQDPDRMGRGWDIQTVGAE